MLGLAFAHILKNRSDGWNIPGQHMLTGVLRPVTGCFMTLHQVLHWLASYVAHLMSENILKSSWVELILVLKVALWEDNNQSGKKEMKIITRKRIRAHWRHWCTNVRIKLLQTEKRWCKEKATKYLRYYYYLKRVRETYYPRQEVKLTQSRRDGGGDGEVGESCIMGELQATIELALHIHKFYNVDLFQRGWVFHNYVILEYSYCYKNPYYTRRDWRGFNQNRCVPPHKCGGPEASIGKWVSILEW